MSSSSIVFYINLAGTICWIPCFYWMHRISDRQDRMLGELREQARRIEAVSRAEHDLIKDVHPQVGEIKETLAAMEEMTAKQS